MKILFCKKVIIPQEEDNIEELPIIGKSHKETNADEAWVALLNAPGFITYINKYGWHFTDQLADYASTLMENDDESNHHWTTKALVKYCMTKGISFPEETATWGDFAYTANMAYADFYPSICKSEDDCIMYAKKVVKDKDGYPGMVFHRWVSDIIGKQLVINWEKFI